MFTFPTGGRLAQLSSSLSIVLTPDLTYHRVTPLVLMNDPPILFVHPCMCSSMQVVRYTFLSTVHAIPLIDGGGGKMPTNTAIKVRMKKTAN